MDRATMRIHDRLDDGQSQPCSPIGRRSRTVAAHEPFKDLFTEMMGNSRPRIDNPRFNR